MATNQTQVASKIMEGEQTLARIDASVKALEAIIGKKYVEKHLDDEAIEADYKEEFARITELLAQKEETEVKILAFKGKRKCDSCKSVIELNSMFCNRCGTKLEQLDFERIIGGQICSRCGAIVGTDVKFCTNCGNQIIK
ncbi:zinc ribbon domain-containing protein [Pseudobutyrivibrio sp.]|uniref:zinc ribbon domain-containing protein n=1 Tax=Pseudobutyrivibrio sp. TaxID=2014367 RepID=UPI0025CDC56B|nr:zinc ribbon domain-containing protein [Pseudobutyrivibrio sp.]